MELEKLESLLEEKIRELTDQDPAHDILHFRRVVKTAKALAQREGAKMDVVVPAAWLHDFVIIPKDDPRRKHASRLSAIKAAAFLKKLDYPELLLEEVAHAIEAHSFSANIPARTLEAQIVQDADRLDGLGAIGIARCFATAGLLKRSFYSEQDPFCQQRLPDDGQFTLDHFFKKLFKVAESLHTTSGRAEGQRRAQTMKKYLNDFQIEIGLLNP